MQEFDRRTLLRYSGPLSPSLLLRKNATAFAADAPVAATTAGKIRGIVEDGVNVFKGIPYGGDTAKTRFKAPVAPTPWREVLDCTAFAAMAPQLGVRRNPASRAKTACA